MLTAVIQTLINGVASGAGYALFAASFALVYSTTRFFHFAHGAVYGAAAYAAFVVAAYTHLGFVAAFVAGALAAALLGGFMELRIYRPLRARGAGSVTLLLASLGLLIAVQNCLSIAFGDGARGMATSLVREGVDVLGGRVAPIQLATMLVGGLMYLATTAVVRWTRAGRVFRAVVSDEELARIVGIDTARTVLVAFLLGSALAGVAAVLSAYDTGIRPTMGFNALLAGIVAMVIGGLGDVTAAYLGGLTLGLVQQVSAWLLPSQWQDAIAFVILILFLVIRPQGLLGKATGESRA